MAVTQRAAAIEAIPTVDARDRMVLDAIQDGLPLVSRPFLAIAEAIGVNETEVIRRLRRLQDQGVIKRLGLIVRHHELGYRANAMVVWDLPDWKVRAVGARLASFDFVTLCYRRERSLPAWPYNLYCMIHGKDRATVVKHVQELINTCALAFYPHAVLFSQRRFKQCGANYGDTRRPTDAETK